MIYVCIIVGLFLTYKASKVVMLSVGMSTEEKICGFIASIALGTVPTVMYFILK